MEDQTNPPTPEGAPTMSETMVCQACGYEAPDAGISPDLCPDCGQDALLFFSTPDLDA